MRWLTYRHDGSDRVGVLNDDTVRGLAPGPTMLDLLRSPGGLAARADEAVTRPDQIVPVDDVIVQAPLQPPTIRDGLGFLDHLRNCAAPIGMTIDHRFEQVPAFYFTNPAAVVGPTDDVAIFPGSQQFDFELEVAAVIGTPGRDIPRDQARQHIAGYTIFCDWSARDIQTREMPMGVGAVKTKDGANTLGPWIVTPDEIENRRSARGYALTMTASVNGRRVGEGRWDSVDWDFTDMITYASRGTELRPGDVIASGTVPTGCLFEHYVTFPDTFPGWLKPGDEVQLAIEQLGTTRQQITAGTPPQPLSTGY